MTGWESQVNARSRNPTIEEQALVRIHRIGQKKEVTTVRFFIGDTFEEVYSLIQ
jgi:SNF2 family DNA or RNA helicase